MSGKAVGTNWEGSWARYLGGGGAEGRQGLARSQAGTLSANPESRLPRRQLMSGVCKDPVAD